MNVMFAEINPDAEMGPVGFYVGAGIFLVLALGMLISGLHPQWRSTATWRYGVSRSVFGTLSFSAGLVIMSAAMVVGGILDQHGRSSRIALWLCSGGTTLIVLGVLYDWLRGMIRRAKEFRRRLSKP